MNITLGILTILSAHARRCSTIAHGCVLCSSGGQTCGASMPEYIVVRCAQCSVFQVRQRPKNRKYKCNICQFRQSLQKVQ